jgi:hypothetical protein
VCVEGGGGQSGSCISSKTASLQIKHARTRLTRLARSASSFACRGITNGDRWLRIATMVNTGSTHPSNAANMRAFPTLGSMGSAARCFPKAVSFSVFASSAAIRRSTSMALANARADGGDRARRKNSSIPPGPGSATPSALTWIVTTPACERDVHVAKRSTPCRNRCYCLITCLTCTCTKSASASCV